MISFVVEAPLADNQIRSGILDHFDHLSELVLLVLLKLLILLDCRDVELMFGLGSGRLEWTCENSDFGVFDRAGHLGVGEVFVNNNTFYECSVF